MDTISYLKTRRSVKAQDLAEPGPNETQIEELLTIAMRVPDHGKLAPWKILVHDKASQARVGDLFAERFASLHADANEKQIAFERARPQRAPLLITVLFTPKMGKIPLWEQQLCTGACCMNMLHAAHAMGFAGQWLTEWPAFDAEIAKALGCGDGDAIAGFIYIGSCDEVPEDRPRPDRDEVVGRF